MTGQGPAGGGQVRGVVRHAYRQKARIRARPMGISSLGSEANAVHRKPRIKQATGGALRTRLHDLGDHGSDEPVIRVPVAPLRAPGDDDIGSNLDEDLSNPSHDLREISRAPLAQSPYPAAF